MPAGIRSASLDAGGIEAALSLEDISVGGADCIGVLACGRRSSFSYRRLPEPQRLRLTIHKLDASCFGTHQARALFCPSRIFFG
jgi:U11/U12 small nuclear ribonucleoprotein 25 kDa protein